MVPPCSECHPGSHPSSRTRCCHPLRGRRAFHLQQGTLCCASVSTASIGILVSSSTPVKSTKGVGVSFRQTNGPITDQLKDILLLYLGNMQWWCRWKWQQRKNAAFFTNSGLISFFYLTFKMATALWYWYWYCVLVGCLMGLIGFYLINLPVSLPWAIRPDFGWLLSWLLQFNVGCFGQHSQGNTNIMIEYEWWYDW